MSGPGAAKPRLSSLNPRAVALSGVATDDVPPYRLVRGVAGRGEVIKVGGMATKAEIFKSETQRTGAAKGRVSGKANGKAHGKKAEGRDGVPHNTAARAAKNSTYEFEVSVGPASRKSTRRSPTHQKTDSALRLATVRKNSTPSSRAARSTGQGR